MSIASRHHSILASQLLIIYRLNLLHSHQYLATAVAKGALI